MELSGPPPVRYPPRVLVGTLLESWSNNDDDGGPLVAEGSARRGQGYHRPSPKTNVVHAVLSREQDPDPHGLPMAAQPPPRSLRGLFLCVLGCNPILWAGRSTISPWRTLSNGWTRISSRMQPAPTWCLFFAEHNAPLRMAAQPLQPLRFRQAARGGLDPRSCPCCRTCWAYPCGQGWHQALDDPWLHRA